MVTKILFLCMAGFAASFVDSIAGGGGLISLPAFLIAGVQPHFALGTNKFSATASAFTSSIKYAASGKVNFKLLRYLIPFTLLGAVLGVNTVLKIDQKFLNTTVFIMILAVSIYTFFSKSMGREDKFKGLTGKNVFFGMLLAFALGFYDGFFGPGTGSFIMFGLISIYGFDFVQAGGNAKVLNFISNITSLILFAIQGKIDYVLGLPVMIFMILGARIGTKMALKEGVRLVKPIFVVMSLGVAVKMMLNIIN
ncbi:TSUP family transporter [Fonticella tunisiensis]|uniref:Probable membrane transporter protein n=1 Tax=Fonticella tunisiensis TaxID=1096341 RepID=A0A4R7KAR9_9CLOT|nr:TSUP family transporter [Fonticella tunisiensis]TDT50813.1 hypothetical protein EDD71_12426 [Fonticella tunisiensis]